jgi:septal ring factor EnvC (AmiA/AmiB activator)
VNVGATLKALRPLALLLAASVIPVHATAQSLELFPSVSERQRQQEREIAKLKQDISSLRQDRDTLSSTLMNTWEVVMSLEADIKKLKQRDNTIDMRVHELEMKAR